MYATNLHDQLINAALPLKPLTAWAGSACTVTVAVPPVQSLAGITVDTVTVTLALPSGNVVTQNAAPVSGSPNWAATFSADNFATSGFVSEGFAVSLVGKDETGTNRIWIVSKGDIDIRPGDASTSPGGSYFVVKLRDIAPAAPTKADAYISGGTLYIYDGTAWAAIGGSSISVDPTLTVEGAAADAKAVGDALRGGFTEWVCDEISDGWTFVSCEWDTVSEIGTGWFANLANGSISISAFLGGNADSVNLEKEAQGNNPGVELSRHLITPTKTSQLTNDGAPNGGGTPYATTAQIPVVTGKADKVANATEGNLASLTAQGNLADSGAKPSDFATPSDLPYRLVEPGKWEYEPSVQLTNFEVTASPVYNSEYAPPWSVNYYSEETGNETLQALGSENALILDFGTFTATRASLPGHLCDRAGNRVVVTGDTTLTLPAAVLGYLRDFLVRLEISGSTVPTITFQGQGSEAPNGADEITYETDGDEFPVPDEAGTWSYSFTENCVAHKFAVALKKVNVVVPPTQGGA